MDKDDLIWERLEDDVERWEKSVRTSEMYRAVGDFILEHKPGEPEEMHPAIRGGYNAVYRLEYKDGSSVIMRVPIPGVVNFPEEKVLYEVATIRYIASHTTIPVPHIIHHGTADENPTGLGPFIIMNYIDHHENMSRALLDPDEPIDKRPILNPNITKERLELLYGQMANILLQLSSLKFPRIGSLVEKRDETGERSVCVEGRPLIANMNAITVHTNAPASILPSRTFASAHEWYSALSDLHLAQLALQHNDAVEDEDDARDKYVARQLFRTIVAEKRLTPESSSSCQDFRLFSEDLRPSNVLLDKDLNVVGVIDWEFAYAAPAQFSFDPPWWLLLEEPDWWADGHREWLKAYEPRLQTFLNVLKIEESKMAAKNLTKMVDGISLTGGGASSMHIPLSQRMRESWENQTWMLNYVARKSWAFDFMWWKFLDEQFFGPNEDQDYQARLDLLTEPQKAAMEAFIQKKMEESKDPKIVTWSDMEAADCLAQVLV